MKRLWAAGSARRMRSKAFPALSKIGVKCVTALLHVLTSTQKIQHPLAGTSIALNLQRIVWSEIAFAPETNTSCWGSIMVALFWSGKGWLVPAITFGASLAGELISEGLSGNDEYYQEHGFPFAMALWISAGINWAVFWSEYQGRFTNPQTERATKRRRGPGWIDHSFMFINQGVWVLILSIMGIGSIISRGF